MLSTCWFSGLLIRTLACIDSIWHKQGQLLRLGKAGGHLKPPVGREPQASRHSCGPWGQRSEGQALTGRTPCFGPPAFVLDNSPLR